MSMTTKLLLLALIVLCLPIPAWALIPVVANFSEQIGSTASDRDSVAQPTSLASGELVILILIHADATAGPCITGPSGFATVLEYGDATEDAWVWVGSKIAGASEPAYYIATSGCSTDEWYMWALRITGHHATNYINTTGAKSVENTTDSLNITEATTTRDSCLAFYAMSFDGGDGDPYEVKSLTNTWTEQDEGASGTNVSTSVGGSWGTKSLPAAGTSGNVWIDCAVADGIVGGIFTIHGISSTDPTTKSQVMSVDMGDE